MVSKALHLALNIVKISSLKCYQCDSTQNPDCGENTKPNDTYLKQCVYGFYYCVVCILKNFNLKQNLN